MALASSAIPRARPTYGQVLVTFVSVQVPASQHAPAVHALGGPLLQSMAHVLATHVGLLPHDMSPVQSMVDASACANTGAGQAAWAAHVT